MTPTPMSVRNALPLLLLLTAVSVIRCAGSPTQADGKVTVTVTTSTTTSSTTTTTVIPPVNGGAVTTAPTGVGLAFATVYTFLYSTPPSGGVPPFTFAWDFGDGNAGAGSAPSHTYVNTGNFVAIATATDSRGMTAQASVPVVVRSVTGRWTATIEGTAMKPEPIDMVQNETAVTATINSTNGFGFGSGSGNVSNPRSLSISATYGSPPAFGVTYVGKMNDLLTIWSGIVTGYPGCPCTFTATR